MKDSRLQAIRALMEEKGLDAMVITKYVNLHYFSGFRGDDTTLVISRDKAMLITDNRYTEQASQQAPLFEIVEQKEGLWKKTAECVKKVGAKKAGFEGNALIYADFVTLTNLLDSVDFTTAVTLDALRQVKDEEEIGYIRKACEIADIGFKDILTYVRPGMTEVQVAAHLENCMRENGSEGPSFPTIMASGLRGVLPHGIATDKVIEEGEFLTMDYGAIYAGYDSDITRTICVGHADDKQRRIYHAVLESQKLALDLIKPGVSGKAVHIAVQDNLRKYGLKQYFGHGLGHSLGLEIHEEPRMSPKKDYVLQENMLITDEPGVYIPDWGGLRIEDTVLVTKTGCEPLTKSSKELIEVAG